MRAVEIKTDNRVSQVKKVSSKTVSSLDNRGSKVSSRVNVVKTLKVKAGKASNKDKRDNRVSNRVGGRTVVVRMADSHRVTVSA